MATYKPHLVVQAGHSSGILSVTFSPDGKTLASGSEDDTIKLWDAATGLLLRTLTGHTGAVFSVTFSPDGKTLASGSEDNTIRLWNTATGRLLQTLTGHTDGVNSMAFSRDGKTLASEYDDKTTKLWDTQTGQLLNTLTGHTILEPECFSPDGKTRASRDSEDTVKLWDAATGLLVHTLTGHTSNVMSVAFSHDGKILASGSGDKTVKLWSTATGQLLQTLAGHADGVRSVAFSPDGKMLASGSFDKTIKLWNTATGQLLQTLAGHADGVDSVDFSPDGKTLANGSGDYIDSGGDDSVKLWNTATGQLLKTLIIDTGNTGNVNSVAFSPTIHTGNVNAVAFSPDGKILASGSEDNTVKLWNTAKGQLLYALTGHTDDFNSFAFSPDGKTLASRSDDKTIKLWNMSTGQLLQTLTIHTGNVNAVAFSPDGKILASGSEDNTVKLWNTATGQLLHTLKYASIYFSFAFSRDGKTLASGSDVKTDSDSGDTIRLWNTATGRLLQTLTGHTDGVNSMAFSRDGKTLASGNDDKTINIWDTATGRELASLYTLGNTDWAVVTPDGRFDASPGGMAQMHYVVGMEPIDLSQLKDRYYEPGLLAKLLGFNKEPLRDVRAFDHVDLTPDVKAPDAVPADGRLPLTLTNRGGGIGRVQVFVNDKELVADARGPKPDPSAQTAALTVDVSHAPGLVPGQANTVRVVTWNAEGYLSSRGIVMAYTPPGRGELAPPDLWAIVGGISDYAGPSLHLNYPAKDADDFSQALSLAAKNLFGAKNVHLTLLDTGGQPDAITPTKANLRQAFEAARKAKPGDIFVVYLAGHGVALPGPSDSSGTHDLYCYLTQDATTGSPTTLSADTQLRLATTVSSEELTEWIKQVPAQKQVMVLDTCAAGAAAATLTAKRDIPSDQIRAIERLKDRTGFYVLMGCAADSVSYETSRYRQGLLTYSLLKGMKGASLRDGQYVDVSDLFNYAVDAVPELAQNIGGVQRPFVAAPEAGSFDVGELSASDRQAIPLASAGVMLLRPELVAEDDDLGLEALLAARLREAGAASARGDADAPALSFVDASDFPGALRPQGTYTVTGQTITVKMKLRRDKLVVGNKVEVTGMRDDLPGLISRLAAAILGAIETP